MLQQDLFFVYLLVEKLPLETRKSWEKFKPGKELQQYDELRKFLQEHCQALESVSLISQYEKDSSERQTKKPCSNTVTHFTTTKLTCECCGDSHKIYKCDKFNALKVSDRAKLIKNKRLCFNCFRTGHRSEDCQRSTCKICNGKHHSLLY